MSKSNTALVTTDASGAAALPIPVITRSTPPAARMREQEADKLRIIDLAERMDRIGWGSVGTVDGMNELVSPSLLWANPLCALKYEDEEIIALVEGMRERIKQGQRAQIMPIIATPAEDPDGTGAKFLIIDGYKRWRALAYLGVPAWVTFATEYATFYDASVAGVVTKTTQHETSDDEFGHMFVGLMLLHENAVARGIEVEPWPSQKQWGDRLGRAQPTISKWLALAHKLIPTVRGLIVDGTISRSGAAELTPLSPAAQERAVRDIRAEQDRTGGATVPRDNVRQIARTYKRNRGGSGSGSDESRSGTRGTIEWTRTAPSIAASELLIPALAQYPAPTACAIVVHDLVKLLPAALSALDEKAPELVALQNALKAPRIAQWVLQTREQLAQAV